jgi:hypothetical protein
MMIVVVKLQPKVEVDVPEVHHPMEVDMENEIRTTIWMKILMSQWILEIQVYSINLIKCQLLQIEMILFCTDSSRGGRNGPAGRKPGGSRLMGRSMGDDPPAPTLSQLKAQMESANGGVGDNNSGGSGTSVGVLPTHMFGNALNPASSMAQRLVIKRRH